MQLQVILNALDRHASFVYEKVCWRDPWKRQHDVEDFQRLWEFKSPWRIADFFNAWVDRAMRSRIEPMKKLVRTLEGHAELIFNWFEAKEAIFRGAVEGMNLKVKLTTRRSFGFSGRTTIKYALYHNLGKLPEPKDAHKFG